MDRVCQFYLRGRCARSNCEFKHVKPSEGGSGGVGGGSSIYRKTPCRFFEANGSCRFGDHCRFFHDASSCGGERKSVQALPLLVDSDEDLPPGIDTDDDDESNVSGFTDYASLVGKKIKDTKSAKSPKVDPKNASLDKKDSVGPKKTSPLSLKERNVLGAITRRTSLNEGPPSSICSNGSDAASSSFKGGPSVDSPGEKAKVPPLIVARKSVPPPSLESTESPNKEEEPPKNNTLTQEEANINAKEPPSLPKRTKSKEALPSPTTKKTSPPKGRSKKKVLRKNGKARRSEKVSVVRRKPLRMKSQRICTMKMIGYDDNESIVDSSEWSSSSLYENTSEELNDPPSVPERTSLRIQTKRLTLTRVSPKSSNRLKAKKELVLCQACRFKAFPKKSCRRCEGLQKSITEPPSGVSQEDHQKSPKEQVQDISQSPKSPPPRKETNETKGDQGDGESSSKSHPPPKAIVGSEQTSPSPKRSRKDHVENVSPRAETSQPPQSDQVDDVSQSKDNGNQVIVSESMESAQNSSEGTANNNPISSNPESSSTPSNGLELPKFDPKKFKPGYIPSIVKKGDEEYAVVVTGVKNTGLCGKYWGDLDNLPPRRKRRINHLTEEEPHAAAAAVPPLPSRPMKRNDDHTSSRKVVQSSRNQSRRRISPKKPETTTTTMTRGRKPNIEALRSSHSTRETQTERLTAVPPALFPPVTSHSLVPMNKERFAPYDDNRWFDIGKDSYNDAVQYTRSLRLPYHLLSFLRIKGHSVKGMSCTDKNNMVFVVIEGEVAVALESRLNHFQAKKGDSFFIPPKNNYDLINNKAREAELCIFQFANEDSIPTPGEANVEQTSSS